MRKWLICAALFVMVPTVAAAICVAPGAYGVCSQACENDYKAYANNCRLYTSPDACGIWCNYDMCMSTAEEQRQACLSQCKSEWCGVFQI